jgi:ATP-binding cassette subfamily B protein
MTRDEYKFYDALPVLALAIMAIQKMLPMAQQIYYCWTHINANSASSTEIIEYLEIKKPDKIISTVVLNIHNSFQMKDVSFTYDPSTCEILRNISLKFAAGERIGIRGPSGGGKSTLVDLILGLLKPSSGTISVDGIQLSDKNIQTWRNNLAHVPQHIYLSDVTIAENIALGLNLEKINFGKVEAAARAAEIHDDIVKMQKGYLTSVGERGINLSGGQRQRIGIARAIYKNANVIILDEATSALDSETEAKVIKGIERLEPHICIVMVAHRLSTLKNCHRVYELIHGKLTEVSL